MVLVIDILSALNSHDQALTRADLESLLDVEVHELDEPLGIGVGEALILPGSGEWAADPASAVDRFTITDAGRERYGVILDRFAQQIVGPPGLSIAERFVLAVSETRPDPLRRALTEIAGDPRLGFTGEAFERQRAQRLAARALGRWAQAALDSSEGSEIRAIGLRSLALGDWIGYAAGIARDDYAPAVDGAAARHRIGRRRRRRGRVGTATPRTGGAGWRLSCPAVRSLGCTRARRTCGHRANPRGRRRPRRPSGGSKPRGGMHASAGLTPVTPTRGSLRWAGR